MTFLKSIKYTRKELMYLKKMAPKDFSKENVSGL